MFYSKILVAFDGSPLGDKALDKAIQLAKQASGAKLEVLHVLSFPRIIVGESFVPSTATVRELAYEEAERVLQRARVRLSEVAVRSDVSIMEGHPPYVIIEYAKNEGCDLIVIGSRGLSGLKKLMLGSVSHYVVQHSSAPVLVVK